MNRASAGYLQEPAPLLLGQLRGKRDVHFNPVHRSELRVGVRRVFSKNSRIGDASLGGFN
jgi:hypothetical protein